MAKYFETKRTIIKNLINFNRLFTIARVYIIMGSLYTK